MNKKRCKRYNKRSQKRKTYDVNIQLLAIDEEHITQALNSLHKIGIEILYQETHQSEIQVLDK